MAGEGLPHPKDVALGASLRIHRQRAGMSREVLAQQCGISLSQLSKYESGANRVGFSRLTEIAHAIGVSVMDVIEPVDDDALSTADLLWTLRMIAGTPETGKLLEGFSTIGAQQRALVMQLLGELVRTASGEHQSGSKSRPSISNREQR